MSKIGLMGGSFDPVHYAHIDVALSAAKEIELDRVILVPTHVQPFKVNRETASDEDRLNMLVLAVEKMGEGLLQISDYEIKKGGISYTFDTLEYFREENPTSDIFFILGSDSFLKVDKWYKGEDILRNYSFLVGVRPGEDMGELASKAAYYGLTYGTPVETLENKMMDISSTMIREAILQDRPISGLVTPEVENYIYEHRLYT